MLLEMEFFQRTSLERPKRKINLKQNQVFASVFRTSRLKRFSRWFFGLILGKLTRCVGKLPTAFLQEALPFKTTQLTCKWLNLFFFAYKGIPPHSTYVELRYGSPQALSAEA